jgi:hypothetical protein
MLAVDFEPTTHSSRARALGLAAAVLGTNLLYTLYIILWELPPYPL